MFVAFPEDSALAGPRPVSPTATARQKNCEERAADAGDPPMASAAVVVRARKLRPGSLVNLQSSAMYPLGAWELHSSLQLIANSPVKPLRIMFNDNEMDNGAGTGEAGARDWLLAGQRTSAALKAKGYHYRWLEGIGAMHCSDAEVQQTSMGDSLAWVWRGYPIAP